MTYFKKVEGEAGLAQSFAGGIVEGANVRTPCGPRRVELVRPGDLIVTRDNGLQAVRMVWSRELSGAQMAAFPDTAPIRLKPRALGPMMPQRDVCLAPDHRVLVPGYRIAGQQDTRCCLIEAKELAGASDAAYVDRSADGLRCFTLVFDTHQVFCINGLPVESFLPTASAVSNLSEDLRDALVRRFPQLRREPNSYPPAEYRLVQGAEYVGLQG